MNKSLRKTNKPGKRRGQEAHDLKPRTARPVYKRKVTTRSVGN